MVCQEYVNLVRLDKVLKMWYIKQNLGGEKGFNVWCKELDEDEGVGDGKIFEYCYMEIQFFIDIVGK